jgi:hypothetical protein
MRIQALTENRPSEKKCHAKEKCGVGGSASSSSGTSTCNRTRTSRSTGSIVTVLLVEEAEVHET